MKNQNHSSLSVSFLIYFTTFLCVFNIQRKMNIIQGKSREKVESKKKTKVKHTKGE